MDTDSDDEILDTPIARDSPVNSLLGDIATAKLPVVDVEAFSNANGPKGAVGRTWFSRLKHRNTGWRMGVLAGLCMSSFVLCSNIIFLFIGLRYGGYADGIGIIAEGKSSSIARFSTVYHVLINILSTLLLTSSNYCMQVLSSPSREDIDRAHGDGTWVEIGLLSVRNLRFVGRKRSLAWLLLLLTSIPLHLL